jgi:hypothetical protein
VERRFWQSCQRPAPAASSRGFLTATFWARPAVLTPAAHDRQDRLGAFPSQSSGQIDDDVKCTASVVVVEDVAQLAGEGLGLAGVSELAAEEATVVAREHSRPLTE